MEIFDIINDIKIIVTQTFTHTHTHTHMYTYTIPTLVVSVSPIVPITTTTITSHCELKVERWPKCMEALKIFLKAAPTR
jgi:hypothetical protein